MIDKQINQQNLIIDRAENTLDRLDKALDVYIAKEYLSRGLKERKKQKEERDFLNGEIKNKSKARIIRDGVVVYSGEILSIFREKNQVKEVGTGLECGISIKDFIDFKEKDVKKKGTRFWVNIISFLILSAFRRDRDAIRRTQARTPKELLGRSCTSNN